MSRSEKSKTDKFAARPTRSKHKDKDPLMNALAGKSHPHPAGASRAPELLDMVSFLEALSDEVEDTIDLVAPNPNLRMALHLMQGHFGAKVITPTSLIGASRVPYATATRRLKDMVDAGLIEQRPRTRTGKSYSMHPSDKLLAQWMQVSDRVRRLAEQRFGGEHRSDDARDYYYGGSYASAQSIPPLTVRIEPLKVSGGVRVLVHGDPTFMVMDHLKRQFEQVVGTQINQRAFSIDRLREEALRNSERPTSRYDIIAVDLPWIGEFAEKGVLMPLDEAMDLSRLDPADFHTAGWRATHWGARAYGVPAQTTPELLFYRRDQFAEAGLEPPTTTEKLLHAASLLHDPKRGRYGIAWNAARGTALGHTVLMTMADFGQPVLDLPEFAGGFDTDHLSQRRYRPTIDTEGGFAARRNICWTCSNIRRPISCRCLGTSASAPMRRAVWRWPMATPCWHLILNWMKPRLRMGRPGIYRIQPGRGQRRWPRSAVMPWAFRPTYRPSVFLQRSRPCRSSLRPRRKSCMSRTAAAPIRAIPSVRIRRCAAPLRFLRRWTACPGATSCNSGHAPRCLRSPRSFRSVAKSFTTCCAGSHRRATRCDAPKPVQTF